MRLRPGLTSHNFYDGWFGLNTDERQSFLKIKTLLVFGFTKGNVPVAALLTCYLSPLHAPYLGPEHSTGQEPGGIVNNEF